MTNLFKKPIFYRLFSAVLLSAVMFFFIMLTGEGLGILKEDLLAASLLFSPLYLGVLCLFVALWDFDDITLLFIGAGVAALICIRVSLIYFASRDYNVFLSQWLIKMRELQGFEPLKVQIGDYNMPYLYFLFILSKFNLNDLLVIKWFSCIFDFVLAFFVMKCVEERGKSKLLPIASFFVAAVLPTLLMNSAYWGQCDSILASFCVATLYFILKGKGKWAAAMFALALSFKLQAIFILPAFIVGVVIKRIKLKEFWVFPVTFIATLLPAIIVGRSLKDTLGIYSIQTSQYPELTLNAPSVFQLVSTKVSFESFNFLGIMLAGFAALTLIFVCYSFKDKIGQKQLISVFYLSALLLPFLLPRMHERYFFIGDMLGVIFLFYNPRKWHLPFMSIFASYNACANYLSAGNLLVSQKYTAIMLLITIIILTKTLIYELKSCR